MQFATNVANHAKYRLCLLEKNQFIVVIATNKSVVASLDHKEEVEILDLADQIQSICLK